MKNTIITATFLMTVCTTSAAVFFAADVVATDVELPTAKLSAQTTLLV